MKTVPVDARVFACYADNNLDVWQLICEMPVIHRDLGSGVVFRIEADPRKPYDSCVWIRFDREVDPDSTGMLTRSFRSNLQSFKNGLFTVVHLAEDQVHSFRMFETAYFERKEEAEMTAKRRDEELRKHKSQEEAQRMLEESARQERRLLKRRYGVPNYPDESRRSPLDTILCLLEDNYDLSEWDVKFLKDNALYPVLAIYYQRIGQIAAAGSCWRKDGNPRRALEISGDPKSLNNYATLTMRGGAYRDLGDLDMAEKCGLQAIKINPGKHYPYNLLGAVYYQRGIPEEGERYYQTARLLGSKLNEEDSSIRSAIEKAEPDARRLDAEYLLKKNPMRYEWARKYL